MATTRTTSWMRPVAYLAVVLLTVGVLGVPTVGAAAGSVDSCRTISTSGQYEVTTDVTSSASSCLNVTASDVVIDGDGHVVAYDGTDTPFYGVNVSTGATNVTVRNLTLSGWGYGVYFEGADRSTLDDVVVRDTTSVGVFVKASSGVTVRDSHIDTPGGAGLYLLSTSTDARVVDNRIEHAVDEGIRVEVSVSDGNATIADNAVVDSGSSGIHLVSSTSRVLRNNTVRGSAGHGIRVETSGETLRDNTLVNNGKSGLYVTADGVSVDGLNASDNAGHGVAVVGTSGGGPSLSNVVVRRNGGDGVRLSRVPSPVVAGLAATNNTGDGLALDRAPADVDDLHARGNARGVYVNATTGASLTNATLVSNDAWAFYAVNDSVDNPLRDVTVGTTTVSVTKNRDVALEPAPVPGDQPAGEDDVGAALNVSATASGGTLSLESTTSFALVNVSYSDGDVATVEESTLDLWGHDASSSPQWQEVAGATGVNASANYVYGNVTFGSLDDDANVYAPLGNRSDDVVTSCTDITASGTYLLDADLSASGTCIEVSASDVHLDGRGHVLSGDGTGHGVVANGSLTNVTVVNLTATGFGHGVTYEGITGGRIDVTASDAADTGVNVNSSRDVVVAGVAAGNGEVGVAVRESGNVTVTARATGNGHATTGVLLGIGSSTGAGVLVFDADGVTVAGTRLANNTGDGLLARRVTDLTVRDVNASADDRAGVLLANTSNARLTNVTANHSAVGVALRAGSNGNVLVGVVAANDTVGVRFNASHDNSLGVTAMDNADYGVAAVDATGNDLTGSASGNEWALYQANASTTVTDLALSSATVTAEARDVALGSVTSPPDDPSGYDDAGAYVAAADTSAGAYAVLNVTYDASAVDDESRLTMLRHDGSSWSAVANVTVDTGADYVSANVTSFGTFAPMENTTSTDGSGSDGGGSDGGGDGNGGGTSDDGGSDGDDTAGSGGGGGDAGGTDDGTANVTVVDASVNRTTATVGEAVEVTATVRNTGNDSGRFEVELYVDGEFEESRFVRVPAGETRVTSIVHVFETAGDRRLRVNGEVAGTVTVESRETPTAPPTATPTDTSETPDDGESADAATSTATPTDTPATGETPGDAATDSPTPGGSPGSGLGGFGGLGVALGGMTGVVALGGGAYYLLIVRGVV